MKMFGRCVAASLVAGSVDLAFAFVYYGWKFGVGPQRILQSVASGWLGAASKDGGWTSAAIGFVSHYGILVVAAWWYLLASDRSTWIRANPWLAGIAYGACVCTPGTQARGGGATMRLSFSAPDGRRLPSPKPGRRPRGPPPNWSAGA